MMNKYMKNYLLLIMVLLNVVTIDLYSARNYFHPVKSDIDGVRGFFSGGVNLFPKFSFVVRGYLEW